ncbi:conserved hypothetical protein [Caldicellulosiruptor hydrothermalis 108]|uniref:Uncharacterized protein n=1 Tax=Caldicellulosiruptor hydrothermalis (strain DSM 18901 / VKM B-2411 / 108) TaxID=632292 RepID=E4QBF7_CALH1|nr:hypothetical protein [Caldicellulosiruptor hydrothermalis]ADQ06059.1 conserved hypothetical protein [Caldicellulosiruptor hydrothermalis 108]
MSDLLVILVGGLLILGYKLFEKRIKTKANLISSSSKTQGIQKVDDRNHLKRLLEIKNILPDGTVVMDNFRYVRIFGLSSQDFDLMSEAEQEAFELSLMSLMRALDVPVQFFITTQRVETTQQVNEIDGFLTQNTATINESLKKYCEMLKNELLQLQKQKDMYVRKSFVSIWVREQNEKVAFEKLNDRTKKIISLFKNAGIKIYQLSMPEVLQLLHDEFNKNKIFKVDEAIKNHVLDLYNSGKKGVVVDDSVIEEVYREETA